MTTTEELDISALARLTGVTSRTLRHYDDVGLLTPAWTSPDGRRHYGREELVRLQHILVLRQLGASLERIGRIVNTDDDAAVASMLREHRDALLTERDRYARLADTVSRTIDNLEKGQPMTADDMFDGFDHTEYEPEARERWGDAAVTRSNAAWKALGAEGQEAHQAEHNAIAEALAALAAADVPPEDPRVQELVERHHAWVSLFWTPDAEAYAGLGDMYVADFRFRANYDKFGDGTAELLRDAILIYAIGRLD